VLGDLPRVEYRKIVVLILLEIAALAHERSNVGDEGVAVGPVLRGNGESG